MPTEILLLGAGHAHLEVLRRAVQQAGSTLRYTLVSPQPRMAYSGMLPGLIQGVYRHEEAHFDIPALCQAVGARYLQDEAVGIDPCAHQLRCRSHGGLHFDVLSINIGARPDLRNIPGAEPFAIPLKPAESLLRRFEQLRARIRERTGATRIALVGAGAGGVETMLAIERRLRRDLAGAGRDPRALSFILVCATDRILPGFPEAFIARLEAVLRRRGIAVAASSRACAVTQDAVLTEGGRIVSADAVFWAGTGAPPSWLALTDLPRDPGGFLRVGDTLQVPGFPNVLAAGDIAAFAPHDLPKSGVYAVRSGPSLARAIADVAAGRTPPRFYPGGAALVLLGTADGAAVGTRAGLVFQGRWVWRWKQRIDRNYMRRFGAAARS